MVRILGNFRMLMIYPMCSCWLNLGFLGPHHTLDDSEYLQKCTFSQQDTPPKVNLAQFGGCTCVVFGWIYVVLGAHPCWQRTSTSLHIFTTKTTSKGEPCTVWGVNLRSFWVNLRSFWGTPLLTANICKYIHFYNNKNTSKGEPCTVWGVNLRSSWVNLRSFLGTPCVVFWQHPCWQRECAHMHILVTKSTSKGATCIIFAMVPA